MEIKRFGDSFIIELCGKRFELYWNRKFKFGENLIQRFCERITEKELNLLEKAINLINKKIEDGEEPNREESVLIGQSILAMQRIVGMQTYAYIKNLPVEDIKNFIDACYPLNYRFTCEQLKKFYNDRYKGCECDLERELNNATCLEDWTITRRFIADHIMKDIVELGRFALLKNGRKYIEDALNGNAKFILNSGSFFTQLFQKDIFFSDLDKRNINPELKKEYIIKLTNIYEEICKFEALKDSDFNKSIPTVIKEKIINGSFDFDDIQNDIVIEDILDTLYITGRKYIKLLAQEKEINRMGDLIRLVEGIFRALPRRKITNNQEPYCKSNEERRNIVLGFFSYWDAHLPDDLAIIKEEKELKERIEKQKQENIDKSDLAYVGKTQAQINAEREANGGLVMEVKDSEGNTVQESNLN